MIILDAYPLDFLLVILDFANNMAFNCIMLHITLVALKKAIFLNILTIFTPRPNFPRLSCHPPIKLGILGEAVDERHKALPIFIRPWPASALVM